MLIVLNIRHMNRFFQEIMTNNNKLLEIIATTYTYNNKAIKFQKIPEKFDDTYQTFCGT